MEKKETVHLASLGLSGFSQEKHPKGFYAESYIWAFPLLTGFYQTCNNSLPKQPPRKRFVSGYISVMPVKPIISSLDMDQ